eukprot:6219564-Amphidinium_carterae.3
MALVGYRRHSSSPHFRKCGVGYHTDTGESVWLPLPVLRQSVYGAELLATNLKTGRTGVLSVRLCVTFGSWLGRSCELVLNNGPGSGFPLEPELDQVVPVEDPGFHVHWKP